jgi:SAM-dependent methyltransferase
MSAGMRTIDIARCLLCREPRRLLYRDLVDRVYSTPGSWSIAQCAAQGCGLLWLDPMPIAEDLHQAYASYYTHIEQGSRTSFLDPLFADAKRGYVANRYGYEATMWQRLLGLLPWLYPGRTSELDFSVMWLRAGARGRLLDVGAGSGWLVEHMSALGWEAEGLDFDARAVEQARARGLVMRLGGLPEQRLAAGSYDAVTMSHSIEHVHDPVGWLAEARRVLRPVGRLAVATPNARSFLHRRFGRHWFPLEPPRHLHIFTRAALESALRKAGFDRFRIFTSARDAGGVFIASRAICSRGRFDVAAPAPRWKRLWGRAVQLQEAALLRLDPDVGEDLVAIAER